MDNEIKKLLEEEIKAELADIATLETGSQEKADAIDELVKLYNLKIGETKNGLDQDEAKLKKDQADEQSKDRWFKIALDSAGIVLPLVFYGVWMRRGFKFEENGTYTSTTFKGLFNRFRPTK